MKHNEIEIEKTKTIEEISSSEENNQNDNLKNKYEYDQKDQQPVGRSDIR